MRGSSTVNNASGRSFLATSNALSMSSAARTSRDRTSIANDVAARQLTKKSPDRESRGSVLCQTDPARRLPFVPASSGPSASYRFMARCRQQSGTALTFQSQRNSARPVRKSVATCSQKMSLDPEYARSRLRTKSQKSARAAMRTRAASHPMLDSAWRVHRREFRSTGYHPP